MVSSARSESVAETLVGPPTGTLSEHGTVRPPTNSNRHAVTAVVVDSTVPCRCTVSMLEFVPVAEMGARLSVAGTGAGADGPRPTASLPPCATARQSAGLAHATSMIELPRATSTGFHVAPSSSHSVPRSPPATHTVGDAQSIASTASPSLEPVQLAAGPVGSVERRMSPSVPTAKHRFADGQSTSTRVPAEASTTFQVAAPPDGLVDVSTLPLQSTPTHSVVDGHSRAAIEFAPGTFAADHAPAPPVGLVEVAR